MSCFDPLLARTRLLDFETPTIAHLKGWLYRHLFRHWMGARVRGICAGRVPRIDRPNDAHQETTHAT